MSQPTYIVADKQTGVWYFRRRVPKCCFHLVKHNLILRTLETKDREEALRYGALCAIASEAVFVHLRYRSGFVSELRIQTLVRMLRRFECYRPIRKVTIAHLAAVLTAWLREDDEEETLARVAYASTLSQLEKAERIVEVIE